MQTQGGTSPPGQTGGRRPAEPNPSWVERIGSGGYPASGLQDQLLVPRAAEGDDDAFTVLVQRHSTSLFALAYDLLGNAADAEEAVQDAFLSAWRRLPEFRGDATFRTWMYRIVTNKCLNILRRRTPSIPLDVVPEPAAHDPGGAPARAAESAAATAALAEALRKLRRDQRACWVLRELHGLHYEEIAQVLGTSEQTVRGRLFRARRFLMKEMAPWR